MPKKKAPLREIVARKLKEARVEKMVTQQELADRLGVSTRYLKELESGRLNLSLGAIEKYCIALKINANVTIECHRHE